MVSVPFIGKECSYDVDLQSRRETKVPPVRWDGKCACAQRHDAYRKQRTNSSKQETEVTFFSLTLTATSFRGARSAAVRPCAGRVGIKAGEAGLYRLRLEASGYARSEWLTGRACWAKGRCSSR